MISTRILVFGTFDYLHPGHINFFKQARSLARNPFLIVSVARNINVKRIKGKQPENIEKDRLALIKSCRLVDLAVLGDKTQYLSHILKLQPQIIALGYDQIAYTQNLQLELKKLGLEVKVVRLKAFKAKHHKTSVFKSKEGKI